MRHFTMILENEVQKMQLTKYLMANLLKTKWT